MIPVPLQEIAALGLGRLDAARTDTPITAIRADSREVRPGELFVALNTGIEYVDEALARGAATLVPDDQEAALAALASLVRSKSDARVVAVVGSAGKTSTKDILGALCAPHAATLWPEKSLNNEIGLPLTVCRLEPETEILVTEMGMRGLGQVAALCAIARPDIAIVSHIGPEHLELVGSVERVAEANAEAIAALPPGGTAVVPASSPELEPFLNREDIELRRVDPADAELADARGRFRLDGKVVELELPFTQRHHAVNTLSALHAYAALGLPLEARTRRRRAISGSRRGAARRRSCRAAASWSTTRTTPTRTRCALRSSTSRSEPATGDASRYSVRWPSSASPLRAYHQEIGELAAELAIEVIGVGEPARAL